MSAAAAAAVRFRGESRGTFFYALFYNGLFYSSAFLCVTSFFFLLGGRRFWSPVSLFGNAVGEESVRATDVLCVVVCVWTGTAFKVTNMFL